MSQNPHAEAEDCVLPLSKRRPDTRDYHTVRFSKTEWGAIAQAAASHRQSPSTFIRIAAVEALPTGQGAIGNAPVIRALGRCGTALARLAAIARASGALAEAEQLQAALAELLSVVRRLDGSPRLKGRQP